MAHAKSASDIPDMDTSHFIPWNIGMLYQVEPDLKEIVEETISFHRKAPVKRANAYAKANVRAEKLVGCEARDPRLRNSGAWDCFIHYILAYLDC